MKKLPLVLFFSVIAFGQWTGVKPPLGTPIDWSHPSSQGIVGLWSNQEAAPVGGTLYDLSGNSNHGTLVADTHSVPGQFGSVLDFDGTGDYVDLGVMPGIGSNLEAGYAFSIWVKTSQATNIGLLGLYDAGESSTFIRLNEAPDGTDDQLGKVRVYTTPNGSTTDFGVEGGLDYDSGVTDGNWHHLAINLDAVRNIISVWIDGVSQTISYVKQNGTSEDYDDFVDEFLLGALQIDGNLSTPINGQIDHFVFYNRLLLASDVVQLYPDPFQMFQQERFPIAAAAPAGAGQVIIIMMSRISPYLIVIGIISILAGTLGYSTRRKAA